MNQYRKAVVSLVTGLLAWGGTVVVSDPAAVTAAEWLGFAGVWVGAFLVWWAPNATDTLVVQLEDDERGAVTAEGLVVGIALGIALTYLLLLACT